MFFDKGGGREEYRLVIACSCRLSPSPWQLGGRTCWQVYRSTLYGTRATMHETLVARVRGGSPRERDSASAGPAGPRRRRHLAWSGVAGVSAHDTGRQSGLFYVPFLKMHERGAHTRRSEPHVGEGAGRGMILNCACGYLGSSSGLRLSPAPAGFMRAS